MIKYNRILITGATGFIGHHVITHAIRERWASHIRLFIKKGTKLDFKSILVEKKYYQTQWANKSVDKALKDIDCVINCVGKLGRWGNTYGDYYQANVVTTQLLVNNLSKQIKKVIHISSPSVLGPISDPRKPGTETDIINPHNNYEITKALSELIILSQCPSPWIIIRPEFVYGPKDKQVFRLYKAIMRNRFIIIGNGNTFLHPTYIDDVVKAIRLTITKPVSHQIFHIAGPRPLTVNQIVHDIRQVFGGRQPDHVPINIARKIASLFEFCSKFGIQPMLTNSQVDFFTQHRLFSTKKAQILLKWEPTTNYRTGLLISRRWYQKHKWLD